MQSAIEPLTPFVADSLLRIDVSKWGIRENLYTDSISASSGYLEFKQGLQGS